MRTIIEMIKWLATVFIGIMLLYVIFNPIIGRIERIECRQWLELNRRDFDPGAFADWQIDQCRNYNVHLDINY